MIYKLVQQEQHSHFGVSRWPTVHTSQYFRFFGSASLVHFVVLEARNVALSTCRSLIPVLMAVQVDKAWMSDATSRFDHRLVCVDT